MQRPKLPFFKCIKKFPTPNTHFKPAVTCVAAVDSTITTAAANTVVPLGVPTCGLGPLKRSQDKAEGSQEEKKI